MVCNSGHEASTKQDAEVVRDSVCRGCNRPDVGHVKKLVAVKGLGCFLESTFDQREQIVVALGVIIILLLASLLSKFLAIQTTVVAKSNALLRDDFSAFTRPVELRRGLFFGAAFGDSVLDDRLVQSLGTFEKILIHSHLG